MKYALFVLLLVVPTPVIAQSKRAMTVEDLFKFKRVSDPQISPDGKHVVYVVGVPDLEKNTIPSSLWLIAPGKEPPRQLTNAQGKKDRHPRWSPDGNSILFESNRSGSNQLWIIGLGGGEARQVTDIATDSSNGIWSRDGKKIAFVSAVWPEYSEKPYKESNELNRKRKDETEKSPVKAKVFTKLFYRHWDEYVEDKRQHLFVIDSPLARSASEGYAEPKDVTPGDRDAFPTSDTFSTGDNFTFSPDGKYLVFTAVPERNEAWSTNYDICRVPIAGGTREWECLTRDNKAADSGPEFSPDGKKLAYRAQRKLGFEADRWELMNVNVDSDGSFKSSPESITSSLDRWIEEYIWAGNQILYFTAQDRVSAHIFSIDVRSRGIAKLSVESGTYSSLSSCTQDRIRLVFLGASLHYPPMPIMPDEQFSAKFSMRVTTWSINSSLLAQLDLPHPDSVQVPIQGAEMQMWILKPPGFDPSKKWPVVYLVHGGPQGAWEDGWSFRWNAQLWAAQGYVVALPNPRGSTGFGQKYIDEISGDWGGKCYDDLMKGVDYLEKLPYLDKDRMAAAGASFGGYMMNWFAVSTPRFKTLISHCGVWNFESMYATTDEVWFDEWEHGGPPWGGNRESYEKFSPHKKAASLGKFKTPMLLIQNDLDFRCPVSQGHELFTALQRQGVESKLVNFPDEGHWVLKPKNSEYWHKEVFAWLKKHVPPGGK
ncbi:MAG TPA: S9 family peptidase [Gemmataceae bacterium]|nr:S9 family peptidase [Gemmataceae bacterium]